MKFDPKKHHRRSIRLEGYDYTQPGGYFITICSYQRECLFGDVLDGAMVLNDCGKIVYDEWFKTAAIRVNIELHPDEFIVMPNHVHGIIWIVETDVRARWHKGTMNCALTHPVDHTTTQERFGKPIAGSIPTIVRVYKAAVTRRFNQVSDSPGVPVWQQNYYEHIIRNDREHQAIQRYIVENPVNWQLDQDNPMNRK